MFLGSAVRVRWSFSTISSTVFVQTQGCGLPSHAHCVSLPQSVEYTLATCPFFRDHLISTVFPKQSGFAPTYVARKTSPFINPLEIIATGLLTLPHKRRTAALKLRQQSLRGSQNLVEPFEKLRVVTYP